MTVWTKQPKTDIYVGATEAGVPTGMHVGTSSEVQADPNATWEKDPHSKIGAMRRINPCIRFVAYSAVPSWGDGGHYTQYYELFVAWNRIPNPDERPYKKYLKDSAAANFIGIHKSISPVKTALKNWMKVN